MVVKLLQQKIKILSGIAVGTVREVQEIATWRETHTEEEKEKYLEQLQEELWKITDKTQQRYFDHFESLIDKEIKHGWKPQGGISTYVGYLTQAMIHN